MQILSISRFWCYWTTLLHQSRVFQPLGHRCCLSLEDRTGQAPPFRSRIHWFHCIATYPDVIQSNSCPV